MKFAIAAFVAALLVAVSIGTDVWHGRGGTDGRTLQSIHYNSNLEMSSQRRQAPAD